MFIKLISRNYDYLYSYVSLLWLNTLIENRKGYEMENRKYNGMCITGFILGVLSVAFYWLVPVLPLIAIIFSGIGLAKIKADGTKGKGLAISGLVLGILFTLQVGVKLLLGQGL